MIDRSLRCCLLLLLSLCGTQTSVTAQEMSFKQHEQLALRFAEAGDYLKAAEQNAAAYAAKPRKTEFAYAAAEQFYLVKDYRRAAEHYKVVARDYETYPLAGLRYARSLKQDSELSEAIAAYLDYLSYYRAADRAVIQTIVEQEVKGAELARQAQREYNVNVVVEPLPTAINTPAQEIMPMPLAAGAIYFTSDRQGGQTRLYRSFESATGWSAAEPAGQFPVVSGKQIGLGALSALGDRFYVSLCEQREVMTQPTARCQIYMTQRRDSMWTTPQLLPPYINTPNNSTSHPYVYRDGEVEVMLFASDRLDGYGGMDLYRTERYLNSEGTDFSFPQNLGPVINGVGNEISPYYDLVSQTLFFSTNGGISMGGYDIFRTLGGKMGWNVPSNMGAPVNSPADDYYFRNVSGTPLAVFASNRALPNAKSRTNNEDLYLVRPGSPTLEVTLQVIDSTTEINVRDVVLAAYVVEGDEQRRLLYTDKSDDGYFRLALPIGSEIELDVQRLDYRRVQQRLTVPRNKREGFQLPRLRMSRIVLSLADVQQIEDTRTDAPVSTLPSRTRVEPPQPVVPEAPVPASTAGESAGTASAKTSAESASAKTSADSAIAKTSADSAIAKTSADSAIATPPAPTSEPVPAAPTPTPPTRAAKPAREYRIQIEARQTFEPDAGRYRMVSEVGVLSSDYIEGKSLYRILVGSYGSVDAAQRELGRVKAAGFRDAFVVGFDYGVYRGMVRN